jgi:xylulose-5-phosphate/fructose-6-phosphate phosphoketolase
MIILRTPKGWTCPKEVDGIPIEGTFRAHQVPLASVKDNPEHLKILEAWMKSYKPRNCSTRTASSSKNWRLSRPWATGAWAAIPM